MKIQYINKVIEFMRKFEQEVHNEPIVREQKQKLLRFKLIEEEKNELLEAYFYKDENYNQYMIQTADAIVDLLYVLYGCYGDFGNTIYEYEKNKIKEIVLSNIELPKETEDYIDVITLKTIPNFLGDLYKAINDNNFENISMNLVFLEFFVFEIAYALKLPLDELFEDIHNSNMSKLHDGKVVKNEYGKIVKSPNYTPAKVEEILKNKGLLND